MIRISSRARAILDALNNRYASQTYKNFYGFSPYRNWQTQFSRIINSLEYNPNRYGKGLINITEWGDIYYDRLKISETTVVYVTAFHFNYRDLHNWFTSATYPPTKVTTSRPLTVNSIYFVKPYRCITLSNGVKAYAIQSDTHLYSLGDKGKQPLIKQWFSSLSFPLNYQIGDLHIIGYGSKNRIPYYIDDKLRIHHGAEIANIQHPKVEQISRKGKEICLTEKQFYNLITECVKKILSDIA